MQALVASLESADGTPPRHVQTHISHVLLHGGHAYKIKKALANPFLDQSTLARRRAACADELRLNRRLAPDLYLDVQPITGTPDAPRLGGSGPLLEVAVRMRAFDEAGLWDRLAARGELGASDIDELAARLAGLHEAAAAAPADGRLGTPQQVRPLLLDSLHDLRDGATDAAERATLDALAAWEQTAFPRLAPELARRLAAGRVREGHGDLHLGNVAREQGRCLVFDGIEFNAELRWLDVMSDLAFMVMDLHAHGLPALAHRCVDAYLQASGDYDGLRVFDYFVVHRALVRAKVARLRAAQAAGDAMGKPPTPGTPGTPATPGTAEAPDPADAADLAAAQAAVQHYLQLALRFTHPRRRALLVTHGLSGSGKTTFTQHLLEEAGAVRVRADVERKRLAGLAAAQPSGSAPGAGLYDAAANAATYERLFDAARAVLDGGWPVILDATFLRRSDRQAARRCAAQQGVPFAILHFEAAPALLRERLRRRAAQGHDASEADAAVLDLQQRTAEPLAADELDAVHDVNTASGAPSGAELAALLARLGLAAPQAARPAQLDR